MKKVAVWFFASALCALVSAIPLAAADNSMSTSAKAANSAMMQSAWPPETLYGTITMVDPGQKLVVVEGPNKALFDMVVTRRTSISSGSQELNIEDLSQYQNKPVSIMFVPERRGDVAESIRVNG